MTQQEKIYLLTTGDGSDGNEWWVKSIHKTFSSAQRAKAEYETPITRPNGSTYSLEANIEEWELEE